MDKQHLFDLVRTEPNERNILDELKRLYNQQKGLTWFQDVIPGLIPGVEGTAPWVDEARTLLWGEVQHREHQRKCERKAKLHKAGPRPLPADRYNLRRHWPAFVEALRPMTPTMQTAANDVYRVLARRDCLPNDRNAGRESIEVDRRHGIFVAVGMVMQDKILSPIIEDLGRHVSELAQNITDRREDISRCENYLQDLDIMFDQRSQNEKELATARQHESQLVREQYESDGLLRALKHFRAVLVDEKEEQDRLKNLKRRRDPGSPNLDKAKVYRTNNGAF